MVDRRTFTTLLAGTIAAPKASFAQSAKATSAFYSAIGPELTLYSVDAGRTPPSSFSMPSPAMAARLRRARPAARMSPMPSGSTRPPAH